MLTLAAAPIGVPLTVLENRTTGAIATRLAMHGLRPGAAVTIITRTAGGGRVIEVAGSRLALGASLLSTISLADR